MVKIESGLRSGYVYFAFYQMTATYIGYCTIKTFCILRNTLQRRVYTILMINIYDILAKQANVTLHNLHDSSAIILLAAYLRI